MMVTQHTASEFTDLPYNGEMQQPYCTNMYILAHTYIHKLCMVLVKKVSNSLLTFTTNDNNRIIII